MLPKNNLEIMKNLLIILVFLLTSFISFGQNIDENGRLESQKLAQVAPKLPEVYLSELKEVKTATTFLLNYSLPEGKNNGEIKFFNPSLTSSRSSTIAKDMLMCFESNLVYVLCQ